MRVSLSKYLVQPSGLNPVFLSPPSHPVISSLSSPFPNMSAHTHGSTSSTQNIVGVHYRVGKKIGEGSFGVIFEGLSTQS